MALSPSHHSQPNDKESRGTEQRQGSKNQQCATLSEITSFCYYLFIIDCYGLEGHFNQQVFGSTPPTQDYLHNVGHVLAALFLFCHVCVLATPFPWVSYIHTCYV